MARISKPEDRKPGRSTPPNKAAAKKNSNDVSITKNAGDTDRTSVKSKVEAEAREFELIRLKKTVHAQFSSNDSEPLKASDLYPETRARSLPDNYGDNLIFAMVRDPYWLFTYWEIQPRHEEEVLRSLKAAKPETSSILRVFDLSSCPKGTCFFDIRLENMVRNWYVHVQPGRSYVVEIGLLHKDGRFAPLARSNVIAMPRASISEIVDEKWMGGAEAQQRLYEASGGVAAAGEINGRSSDELQKMIEKQFMSGVSSGSGSAWLSGISSASGRPVQLMGQDKQRGFWFVLDCEVIVYGATEPDARVTFQGREMKLRPDGTFSTRFALPDGSFIFEAKAFSADGIEERTITPTVQRDTERPAPVLKEF